MTKIVALIIFNCLLISAFAQSTEKVMEKRAKEMHRVIGINDEVQWKKFVTENYTQALIDKPMQARVNTSENGSTSTSSSQDKSSDSIEAKTQMFQRLHDDFGGSKLISLKPAGEKMEMVLRNDEGMTGIFKLKFEKTSPYKIDGLGIEVEAVNP